MEESIRIEMKKIYLFCLQDVVFQRLNVQVKTEEAI